MSLDDLVPNTKADITKATTILRVQDSTGEGPYSRGLASHGEIFDYHNQNLKRYPLPNDDTGIGRYMENQERCGFKNVKQLLLWFSKKELKALKKLGFKIEKVKGVITATGVCQVLFVPCA